MTTLYNLQELAAEALEDLNSIGIYPRVTPNDFTVNKRSLRRFGLAVRERKNGTYKYSINISVYLLDMRNDKKNVMKTIYHECLHCCDECWKDGHTGKWLEYAKKVSRAFDTEITRCGSFFEELDEEVYKEKMEKEKEKRKNLYNYTCECSNCRRIVGRAYNRLRAPKWYTHPKQYVCNYCGSNNLWSYRERV